MDQELFQSSLDEKDKEKHMATYNVEDQCLIIHLHQELDHHLALYVREKSDKLIDKRNIRNIIFDFSQVGFTDSSGIGVIMGRYKRVIFTGGKVAVTNVNSTVDRIFKLSGIYKIVHQYQTVEEALEDMRVV